jgi:hypothetical protein
LSPACARDKHGKRRASAEQGPKARQDFSRHLRIFQPAAAGRDLASPLIFEKHQQAGDP